MLSPLNSYAYCRLLKSVSKNGKQKICTPCMYKLTNYITLTQKTHRLCVFVMCNIYPLSITLSLCYLTLQITPNTRVIQLLLMLNSNVKRDTTLNVRQTTLQLSGKSRGPGISQSNKWCFPFLPGNSS